MRTTRDWAGGARTRARMSPETFTTRQRCCVMTPRTCRLTWPWGESSAAVFAADSLPDLDEDQLAAVGRVTRRLLGALGADEALEDEIRHQAEVLCRLLAPAAGEAELAAEIERARQRLEAGAKQKRRPVALPRSPVTPGGEMGEAALVANDGAWRDGAWRDGARR